MVVCSQCGYRYYYRACPRCPPTNIWHPQTSCNNLETEAIEEVEFDYEGEWE